ncbi:MAG: translation elongation factor Ts [Candidatus Latescibacterota bacterium]|nr:MAG: translation elongation factor Ts [Candidatus Latescibacterota bacterium]RKY73294.1 MAG: translation elongation factor Ts [Candidatus Latescibacterota bacterium]HDN67909.1 translation elongation factor Ts [Bacillota bacterium]
MTVTAEMVRKLREKTGAGIMDCKRALNSSGGDFDKAISLLRERGISVAAKRMGRATKEGIITSYIHPGSKLGVLVEVNCETDFVARTEEFQNFAKNIAMQIAAANPMVINKEDLPAETTEKEKQIYRKQAEGKPETAVQRIVDGKLEKFFQEVCLLEQPFIKDPNISVRDLLTQTIAKLGENISIKRFVRYRLGEE